jgi:hypothetical protein
LKVWLEDSVPTDLVESIIESKGSYTSEKQVEAATKVYDALQQNRISEMKISLERLEDAQKELQTTNV